MPPLTGYRRRRPHRGAAAACLLAALPLAALLASCSTQSSEQPETPPTPPTGTSGSTGSSNSTGTTSAATTTQFDTPRKPDGKLLIKIVTNGISPFWDPMAVGMKKAAGEVGCDAEWAGPRDGTVTEQKRMVEDAIAKGADGIAISCIEAEASVPIIEEIVAKKIPCITFDSDSPKADRLCYIGTNNFNAGKAAGEAAVRLFPNGGKVMAFVGNISAQNARERRDGFVEASKPHKIELIDTLDDNKDPARAQNNVNDTMAKYGEDVQGLLGLFSYNGPAIVQAVSRAGKQDKYKCMSFDAEPVTLNELDKGPKSLLSFTIVQKPYDFGYLSTKLLYEINRKGWPEAKKAMKIPDNGIFDTGVQVITPENIKQYRESLVKLGVKSS